MGFQETRWEKVQEEKWEQLLLQISNSVSTLCGYERIKNVWVWLWVGQWAWPGGMWLDITPYTHSIFLSWDITCNQCQYNTVLIQSLMHLRQLPAHFQDLDTESDDGVLCTICSEKSHLVAQRLHYWIECDRYDAWVHTYCAFGSNANSCLYVCDPHIRLFFGVLILHLYCLHFGTAAI